MPHLKAKKASGDWVPVAEYVMHKDPDKVWAVEQHAASGHLRCHCPAFIFNPECLSCWEAHGGLTTPEHARFRAPLHRSSDGHRHCSVCGGRQVPHGPVQPTCKHIRRSSAARIARIARSDVHSTNAPHPVMETSSETRSAHASSNPHSFGTGRSSATSSSLP